MRITIIAALASILAIWSCQSPKSSNDKLDPNFTMEQLKVSPDFDWETSRTTKFVLSSETGGMLQVVSLKKSGLILYNANLPDNASYTFYLTVPAYEKEVKLRHRGEEITVDVSTAGLIEHRFQNKTRQVQAAEAITVQRQNPQTGAPKRIKPTN